MELDMKNGNHQFCHESLQDRETIAELLSSLQQGLARGRLKFSDEDGNITLKPSGLLNLTIMASASSELNVVDVRISWQSNESDKIKKELCVSND